MMPVPMTAANQLRAEVAEQVFRPLQFIQ